MQFPGGQRVQQVRIARPTDRFEEIVTFYRDAIGLELLVLWRDRPDGDHAGYDGAIFGLPDATYHLEFTHHRDGSPGPAPSKDNLLVLYVPDELDVQRVTQRMERLGHAAVAPENPWWDNGGFTYEDPDGWRVVIMRGVGLRG